MSAAEFSVLANGIDRKPGYKNGEQRSASLPNETKKENGIAALLLCGMLTVTISCAVSDA